MSRSANASFLAATGLAAVILGSIASVAVRPAAAEEPRHSFGTQRCDRVAMTSNSGAGHALTRGPLAAGEIARAMQPVDHSCIGWALGRATSATTVSWDNPGGHARYSVMLVRTYDSMTGERCRDYVMTAVLDKGPLRTEDTACRNADGAWHLTVHNGAPIAPGSEILPTAQPGGAAGAPPAVPAGTGRTTAKKSAQAAPGKPPAAD